MNAAQRRLGAARRGVSYIAVLGILSVSLALSYSVIRTQSSVILLQRNSDRRAEARQAAMSGLAEGLRRMHRTSWSGVDATFSGWISDTQRYDVRYTAGDDSLTQTTAEYGELPYRVTVTATGYAADVSSTAVIGSYQIRAVVRLAPVALPAEPAGWSTVQQYTLYQWRPQAWSYLSRFDVEVPSRIEGAVRAQKEIKLCDDHPEDETARKRLLSDLNQMRSAGYGDQRPFSGPLHVSYSDTPWSTRSLLTSELGLSISDHSPSNTADWRLYSAPTTYRMYPGGPTYSVQQVGGDLSNVTLEPNPATNPLGLFQRSGSINVWSNVTVRGTLLIQGGGDLRVLGQNVRFLGADLRALTGGQTPIQLPVLIVDDDLDVANNAGCEINGMVCVGDDLEVFQGPQSACSFTLRGRATATEIVLRGRDEWDRDSSWWAERYSWFAAQLGQTGGVAHFPEWLRRTQGLNYAPRILFAAPAAAVTYHWKENEAAVYAPAANDEGLRWDVVDWRESR